MTTDTTLYEIYSDLGLLDMLQDAECEQFIDEECAIAWSAHTAAAA